MEENKEFKAEVELAPFVIIALSSNKKLYRHIDEAYKSNKYEYYKAAKNDVLYDHPMFSESSILYEEYCKKLLGLFAAVEIDELAEEAHEKIFQLIIKGYPWTYFYNKNHSLINLDDFAQAFKKKFNSSYDSQGMNINNNINVLIFLGTMEGKSISEGEFFKGVIRNLYEWFRFYNDLDNNRVSLDKATEPEKLKIKNLKATIYNKYGKIKKFNDLYEYKVDRRFIEQSNLLFDIENISNMEIFEDVDLSTRDIDSIFFLYIIGHDDTENIENAMKFFVTYLNLLYLIKAYKLLKKHYFENNKETMYVELDGVEKVLNKTNEQLNIAKNDIEKIQRSYELLEKENSRLKTELENEKRNKEELIGLRNFIFTLDKQEQYISKEIDLNRIKKYNAIVIGGHEKWQQRMKELLPNFRFIRHDNLNFDTKIFDNINTVFIYVNFLNHTMYYKVMGAIKGKDIKVVYLNQQNEERTLNLMYEALFS